MDIPLLTRTNPTKVMKYFMKNNSMLLGLLVLASGLTVQAQDKADCLAIITGTGSSLTDVSKADLERFFRADKTKAPDGTKVSIVMLDTGRPEREAALRGIYKMGETEYNDFFVSATFTGAVAAAPKSFPTPMAVKKYVATTPGAISYIRASDADDTVKVLKVDGKAPGDADYSLKMK